MKLKWKKNWKRPAVVLAVMVLVYVQLVLQTHSSLKIHN